MPGGITSVRIRTKNRNKLRISRSPLRRLIMRLHYHCNNGRELELAEKLGEGRRSALNLSGFYPRRQKNRAACNRSNYCCKRLFRLRICFAGRYILYGLVMGCTIRLFLYRSVMMRVKTLFAALNLRGGAVKNSRCTVPFEYANSI